MGLVAAGVDLRRPAPGRWIRRLVGLAGSGTAARAGDSAAAAPGRAIPGPPSAGPRPRPVARSAQQRFASRCAKRPARPGRDHQPDGAAPEPGGPPPERHRQHRPGGLEAGRGRVPAAPGQPAPGTGAGQPQCTRPGGNHRCHSARPGRCGPAADPPGPGAGHPGPEARRSGGSGGSVPAVIGPERTGTHAATGGTHAQHTRQHRPR